eukprot:TRINITY_DN380_c0_g1_i1.p1 TRINITY_DN380_c0_g1~~TRINITY_DN380_c0_g1_i1.p1  ORF type:complete len:187 (-),score=27.90 TRINITY_DN380_c0_g1_i1:46-606(-)
MHRQTACHKKQSHIYKSDSENTGKLTFEQLRAGYVQVRAKDPDAAALAYLGFYSKDKDSAVSLEEAANYINLSHDEDDAAADACHLLTFLWMDDDKDGMLTLEEFLKVFRPGNLPEDVRLSEEDIEYKKQKEMEEFKKLDTDNDGKICYEEYKLILQLFFIYFHISISLVFSFIRFAICRFWGFIL